MEKPKDVVLPTSSGPVSDVNGREYRSVDLLGKGREVNGPLKIIEDEDTAVAICSYQTCWKV